LKRARYTTTPLGHYGLAKTNYTHFTSPIRRYADLEVHRALAERDLPRRSSRAMPQLSAIADHISATERNAAEAEIDAVKMKKLEFFESQLEARNPQIFDAVVIDVRNYGLLVELPEILLTGLVHVSTLADDFYIFSVPSRRRPATLRPDMDHIIEAKEVQIERKHLYVEFRENDRGRVLRITEEAHGRRNTIIVPSTGTNEFTAAIEDVLGATEQ